MAQCFAVRSLLIGQQMFFASWFIFYHAVRICEPSFLLLPLFIERIQKIDQSEVLPGLDINLLSRCLLMASRVEAVKEFRRGISAV